MKASSIACSALVGAILLSAATSEAVTCSARNLSSGYDSFYKPLWGCGQIYVNDMWSRFHFDHDDWDSGFGYEDPCNNNLPLMRTFNGLQVLGYAATANPTCTFTGNPAIWGYCWAGAQIDELDAMCGDDAVALTAYGGLDDYTELYIPFFYDQSVPVRASTIFHEARHAHGWCAHTDNCLDGEGACDPNLYNGCVGWGSGSGMGANGYEVWYLNWFATTARSNWITQPIRDNAVLEANKIFTKRFETNPCLLMNSAGYTYSTC